VILIGPDGRAEAERLAGERVVPARSHAPRETSPRSEQAADRVRYIIHAINHDSDAVASVRVRATLFGLVPHHDMREGTKRSSRSEPGFKP